MRWMYFILIPFFISCGGKKQESVTEEMKATEINDTSTVEKKPAQDPAKTDSAAFAAFTIDKKLPFDQKAEKFIEKYKFLYSETESDKTIIPERYENVYSKKMALRKNSTVSYGNVEGIYPVAQLWFFQYKDSVSCRNVLNNWLQCYGFDCTPVEFMVDLPAIKTTPSMAIINEKEIIFLQYQCEHMGNNWEEFKKELENVFAQKGSCFTLTISGCGKKLVWKKL